MTEAQVGLIPPDGAAPWQEPPSPRFTDSVRLMLFVAAVLLLFFVARQGRAQPLIYASFSFFLVTTTLWVRGLDANWIAGREDYRSKWLLWLALGAPALATALIGLFVRGPWSTIVLGILITLYIAAGLAVRKLRWRVIQGPDAEVDSWLDRRSEWFVTKVCRWWVLTVLLVVAYSSLWGLGRAPLMLAGLVLLGSLVLVPAVVQVLSERRIVALSLPGAGDQHRWWVIGGATAAGVGVLIAAAFLGQTRYLLVLVVVVALLTWAFAVGSLADIAVVLAALALMGVTPGSQEVKPAIMSNKPTDAQESVVVALGDSYTSGEGASLYLDATNVAGANQCRRAATAWPVLVAQSLGAHRLVFRACSGARARNLVGNLAEDEQYDGEGIQLDRAVRDLRAGDPKSDPPLEPELVVLSIGGNDAGFSHVGSSCLSLGRCDDKKVSKYFYDNLPDLGKALKATYLAIAKKFPHTPIAVMPYPDAFATTDGCVQAPVDTGDIAFVSDFTDKLDATIEKVATQTGAYYVAPMRTALTSSHLALCDGSGAAGLNFLDLRGVGGTETGRFNPGNWIHNSLHPNERGHAAFAAAFADWLSSQERNTAAGKVTGLAALLSPADKRAAGGDKKKPKDLPVPTKSNTTLCFEKVGGDCGPHTDAWALARLGPGMFLPLLLAGLVAAGSWAFAVGVSATRFRRRSIAPV